jgi:hypothetical protein
MAEAANTNQPPPAPQASDADPELIWRICPYLRLRTDEPCHRCPRWEKDRDHDWVQRGCFALAQEVVNICQTGNAWRRA